MHLGHSDGRQGESFTEKENDGASAFPEEKMTGLGLFHRKYTKRLRKYTKGLYSDESIILSKFIVDILLQGYLSTIGNDRG